MGCLKVTNVTKRFGGLTAVSALDLTLQEGQIIGLIGPNGAGKTTAFHVISGYYTADDGDIVLDGANVRGLKPEKICKLGLTRTFQVTKPFAQLTVLENVMIGAFNRTGNTSRARARAREIISFLGMSHIEETSAGGLPIGWQKRLEVARAIATEPKILLLDEVMAGLRPTETEEMIQLVRQVVREKGLSVILVEHVMRVIMSLADRIAVMHHGAKIAEDTPDNIVRNQDVIDAYLGEELPDA